MKTKSRFLRAPVEPFTVAPDATADDLLGRMERISFQGRNLATARRIWEKMLANDCTVFLGMAGALSAGGLRMSGAPYLASSRSVSDADGVRRSAMTVSKCRSMGDDYAVSLPWASSERIHCTCSVKDWSSRRSANG